MPGQQPWQVLSSLPAWHLTQVLRSPQRGDDGSPDGRPAGGGAMQRGQELVSAYCRNAPVAVAWVRERAGGPVRVIVAGPGLAAGSDDDQQVLTLPAGGRGQRLPDGQAARLLGVIPCWTELAGVCDVLLADQDTPGLPRGWDARPSLEDGLLSAWLGPFGWLLLAEPADEGTLEKLASEVALEQVQAQRFDSPRAKIAERRAAARHAELRQAASTGLWRVHLLAGAATPQQAAQVAGLLRASTDLAGLPYALLPARHATRPPEIGHEPLPAGRDREPPARRPMAGERELQWAVTAERHRAAAMSPCQQAPASPPAPVSPDARWPAPQPAAPFYGSTALVAALARVPAREVPGLRMVLRPQFDLTPEGALAPAAAHPGAGTADGGTVRLGEVLDWNKVPCGDLAVPLASLNRHVLVCGATGAGKSQMIRNLLEQATQAGIPWLVIEPAKAEYQLMAARLPGVEVIRIRPGDLGQPPAGINPLEPAAGPDGSRFPLQAHADLLRALFLAAFQADEPFPQVLSAALTRCYEQAGWDLVTGQPATPGVQPAYPAMEDLQAAALTVVGEIGYGREVADNVRGFVTVRIGSLRLGTTGRPWTAATSSTSPACCQPAWSSRSRTPGDDRDKAFLMGAMLIRLTEHLRLRHRAERPGTARLRHLTVIEEAHRLLRQPPPGTGTGPAAQATEMLADLLAEVRAYGEGLVIAEQIPAKLIPDVIKNTAVKITHRLPAADDREVVGATMNLTPGQSAYLVTLTPGEAAVHADGMDYPLLAQMPDGTSREATPATAASPAPVIGRRSTTCGTDCHASACTLAQVRAAQRATITDPRITLWAELAVLAHLTGWTMPAPGSTLTRDLQAMPARLRDCALSQATDTAVAARTAAISTRISPATLAVHVADAMRHAVAGGTWLCQPAEPQYLAPAYRWALVLDALTQACRDGGHTGRHPQSGDWEHAYGQPVPGPDCAAQLAAVRRWHDRDCRDPAQVATVAWGTRQHTAIEQAVGTRATAGDWEQQLTDALSAFRALRWPLTYLRPAGPGNKKAGSVMSGSGDSPYTGSLDEAAGTDRGVMQAHRISTELAEAPPAEPMSREEYADYMRQGPAAGPDDYDTGGENVTGYASESGHDGDPWNDPAGLIQDMTREQYADHMLQGPAAGTDDHHPVDGYGLDATGDAGRQPGLDDPAAHAQGMSRSEYADYMRQGPAADDGSGSADAGNYAAPDGDTNASRPPGAGQTTTGIDTADPPARSPTAGDDASSGQQKMIDGEVTPDSGDDALPDAADGPRDEAGPGTQVEAEHHRPDEHLEKSRPGHPDVHDRYPADYELAPDGLPPRIDGPHESPEKWLDAINPDKADDGRSFNCGDCSRSVDSTWHGFPAIAAAIDYPRLEGELPSRMTEWAGVPPKTASMADINQRLGDLGPGSSAVVGCDWKTGGGHWFNAVNDGGTVKAADGQSGKVEAWPPTRKGLGYDESRMWHSDAIYFTPDGKVVRHDHP